MKMRVNLNSTQRLGAFVALTTIAILIFLHQPWSGYETFSVNMLGRLNLGTTEYSFFQYKSRLPIVEWLGDMTNFLASIALVIAVYATLFFLYAEPKAQAPEQ